MTIIFDIGRTHKKFILFDQEYKVVEEKIFTFPDIKDEDGDDCEDLNTIVNWMKECTSELLNNNRDIRAINFSAHGASLVHINKEGYPATPLYDYIKPVDAAIHKKFYALFGGETAFSLATGSPALNMINSGFQLFWLKKSKPGLLKKIQTSLHLPQYANFIFTGKKHADITSIGCHTGLWNFTKGEYHSWIKQQGISNLLPAPEDPDVFDEIQLGQKTLFVGIGLHDSSAALLPFIYTAKKPFVLLSTGTWNITLNPFFEDELSEKHYQRDCLYYLLTTNKKVAASRLFLGSEFQYQIKRLSQKFGKPTNYHNDISPDADLFKKVLDNQSANTFFYPLTMRGTGPFPDSVPKENNLDYFSTFEEAYHKLMLDLTYLQKISIELVCGNIKNLYITGGFARNNIFMELLQSFLPEWQIVIAENSRASALGAAVAIHRSWSKEPLPQTISPIIPFKFGIKLDLSVYKYLLKSR